MAAGDQPASALPVDVCQVFSDVCGGEVDWRADGSKRCDRHQSVYERARRKQMLLSWTVAALIVVAAAVVVNALIRPEQGPSQARAWEVRHEYAAATLEIGPGTQYAELSANPSVRVKVVLASDLYRVFSYYVRPDATVESSCARCAISATTNGRLPTSSSLPDPTDPRALAFADRD